MSAKKGPPQIKYVFIPVDPSLPMEELTVDQPEGQEVECLTNRMQEHYRKQNAATTQEGRDEFRKMMAEKMPGTEITEDLLSRAVGMQLVESVPLLPGGPHSQWLHVNLYCDDKGQMKSLPVNPRACGFSEACGRPSQIYGDCFIGRIYEDANDFYRLDFELKEVSSAAEWVKFAHTFNTAKVQEGPGKMQEFAQLTGGTVQTPGVPLSSSQGEEEMAAEALDPGEKPGAFTWSQSGDEVVISVSCPTGTKSGDVKCKIRPGSLSLSVATLPEPSVFEEIQLFGRVATDESTWTIETSGNKRLLVITLTKEKAMRWLDLKTAVAS